MTLILIFTEPTLQYSIYTEEVQQNKKQNIFIQRSAGIRRQRFNKLRLQAMKQRSRRNLFIKKNNGH